MLPPVVDVELYGEKNLHPPTREAVTAQLSLLLEEHYGVRPVLYATGSAYKKYLSRLGDGRDWTFWQYTDRGRLAGYEGEEVYIDLNVFNGTEEQFAAYTGR